MRAHLLESLRGTVLLGVPLALVAVIGEATAPPATLRTIVNFLITLTLVIAIQSFSGNSGIVSFGHVAFMGIGAYTAALVTIPSVIKQTTFSGLPGWLDTLDVGFVPAVLIGTGASALVAALIGVPLARMREGAMGMATIGVLVIFFVIFDNWDAVTRGAAGVFAIPQHTGVYSALAFSVVAVFVARLFRVSNLGLQLRASKTDAVAAEALGADVVRMRWVAWTFSGGVMGMGGALWAEYNIAFDPKQFLFDQTFQLLAMLVVGGLASVSGAVFGAAMVTAALEIMRRVEESSGVNGLAQMVVALLILVVLYYRREGLLGAEVDEALARKLRARRSSG